MRIIQINASYKPAYIYGGPTMSVSKLSEELVKHGENVEVFTTAANGETELDINAGIKTAIDGVTVTYFNRITKDPSHFSPALLFSLWNILRDRDSSRNSIYPKIVHIHAWWNFVSVGSCAVALLANCQVILSPRGNLSSYSFTNRKSLLKNIFHQSVGKALLKRCHFHVTSEKEKQDILKIVIPKSLSVIPNFVRHSFHRLPELCFGASPTTKANSTDPIPLKNPFKLLFLSRIEEKKGLDILFAALREINFAWHLTIAGSGHPNYVSVLKKLTTELNIDSKISWIGHQDNEQKSLLLKSHDLMVLPSHDENFANVVIESLIEGTPVLISKNVGLAEYVIKSGLGWVSENSPAGFGRVLESAFHDKEKRIKIRSLAPQQIAIDFNDQYILNQYLQMYDKVRLCPSTLI